MLCFCILKNIENLKLTTWLWQYLLTLWPWHFLRSLPTHRIFHMKTNFNLGMILKIVVKITAKITLRLEIFLSLARLEGVTVIHFCGKWFQTFLHQFYTNIAEFLIWCRNFINEEPLSRIFRHFKKIFRKAISNIEKYFNSYIYLSTIIYTTINSFPENFGENSGNSGKIFGVYEKFEREVLL